MAYDKKICDEYLSNLSMVNHLKAYAKDYKDAIKRMTYVIDCLHEKQVTIKAAKQVQDQIKRYLSQNQNKLVYWEKRSKKSAKAYKQYCDNKEQL